MCKCETNIQSYSISMADIRDIIRDRLPNFEKYLGDIPAIGQATEALNVRHFQKGTIMIDVTGLSTQCEFVVQGTDNKGLERWFNLDPCEENVVATADGNRAATYELETTWIRVLWLSGAATRVSVNAKISKTIIGNR